MKTRGISPLTVTLTVSLVLNAMLMPILLAMYDKNKTLNNTITTLTVQYNELSQKFQTILEELNYTKSQLQYYKQQVDYYSRLIERIEGSFSKYASSSIFLVAVKEIPQSFFTVKYEGVTMTCNVEITEGNGRILVNTNPRIGIDLQSSVRTAVIVAENYTGISLKNADIILSISSKEPVEVVDGPSAGAAITVAIIAALLNSNINRTVYMTGTINPDGSIGPVSGIVEKAIAAAKSSGKVFLVPPGQSKVAVKIEKKHQIAPGYTIIEYTWKVVDLQYYLKSLGFNITVIEVSNIEEACHYVLL